MFSKSKINDPNEPATPAAPERAERQQPAPTAPQRPAAPAAAPAKSAAPSAPAQAPVAPRQAKPAPSIISADLTIKGNLETTGDMQIEGTIEGDIRSHLLTIGQNALVRGEIVADDVVVNGRVIGRIRGQKIRLSATAKVDGDILHKNIAIESGAIFEGSVQRSEDPVSQPMAPRRPTPAVAPAPSGPKIVNS